MKGRILGERGKVTFFFECRECKEKIRLPLYFGVKRIWNNSTSPTLQKLYPHQGHRVGVRWEFEPV
ncbi:MAG: hypothetical protein HYT87_20225 [Nitrospirae bacterium]|nr:hypothetical protein [Nitrospirota bacterium]